jgi:phosphoglycolate phosphatase
MTHPGSALRAIVFDLDGTLVDTAGDFIPVVQALRAEAGLPPMDEDRIRATVSNGARALVTLGLGLHESDAEFEDRRLRLLSLYDDIIGRHAVLYPGMSELLAEIDARNMTWGIATNKPRGLTEKLLAILELSPPSLVCPDDVTHRKPHPESLERACAELTCAPEHAIYIGDHARDIEAGRAAGLYTIAAAYGYIEPGDRAQLWGADTIVDSSEAIAAAVFTAA